MTAGGYFESGGITYDAMNITDGGAENLSAPGAANTLARVVYAPIVDGEHLITYIQWGYDAEPTGGRIVIEYGLADVFRVPVTAPGAGFLPVFIRSPVNTRVRVTLAAAGAGVRGSLNVGHRVERPIEP